MDPITLLQLMSNPNPLQAAAQMFGSNPAFMRAQQMAQGKSPEQLRQTVYNLAQQRGISTAQLQQMANQFGIKL